LAGNNPVSNTTNTENSSAMTIEAKEQTLHKIAKVDNFLYMWQGRQNLGDIQKESGAHIEQMTAIGYLSDMEDIVNASWSLFHRGGAAACELSE
jgi:hypothetical protein